MALEVVRAGALATVQDLGRFGGQRYGLSPSGAMDTYALRAGNALVGNPLGAAALEVGLGGLTLAARRDTLVALTGTGCALSVQGRPMPTWTAVWVHQGLSIELSRGAAGWAYLAVAGGIETPPLLGSRATHLRAGLGGLEGRPLRPGDVLPTGAAPAPWPDGAGRHIPIALRPAYSHTPVVAVVLGPQADLFTAEGAQVFLSSEYQVSAKSDRMGYRLEGPAVAHRGSADIISDGLTFGSVQVPSGGQPLVMMSERPTTGGYTKIATVISADLPRLAQAPPGIGRVRFQAVGVDEAQARLREQMRALASSVQPAPDDFESW